MVLLKSLRKSLDTSFPLVGDRSGKRFCPDSLSCPARSSDDTESTTTTRRLPEGPSQPGVQGCEWRDFGHDEVKFHDPCCPSDKYDTRPLLVDDPTMGQRLTTRLPPSRQGRSPPEGIRTTRGNSHLDSDVSKTVSRPRSLRWTVQTCSLLWERPRGVPVGTTHDPLPFVSGSLNRRSGPPTPRIQGTSSDPGLWKDGEGSGVRTEGNGSVGIRGFARNLSPSQATTSVPTHKGNS